MANLRMPCEIAYSRAAAKALMRAPRPVALRIRDKLRRLADDPLALNPNVRRLTGRAGYRLRVGDWRVVYDVEVARVVIWVIDIGPRGDIYR